MSQWNNGPYGQDPNQAYYAGQPGYPPQQPGYPPQGGFVPQGGYPPQGGGIPPQGGYPQGGYPPGPQPGFQPPPYAAGEQTPLSNYAGTYGASYPEDPEVKGFDFGEASVRRGFIRKVYSILCVQLGITLAFICWFVYHKPTQLYIHRHPEISYISFAVILVVIITLACCGETRRKAPMNFILLFIFTLAESLVLGTNASFYKADSVVMAVGITAAVCLGLTLFAFQTKWDFTLCGGFLFVAVLILLLFGIIAIFVGGNKIFSLIYASLGALIFSLYLIYDTQLMLGGNHKYSISPEEYIFAALNLYMDIVNIFMYILAIIGNSRD